MSLAASHDDIERDVKAVLALAAGELGNGLMIGNGAASPDTAEDLLLTTSRHGGMGTRHVLAITDRNFKVVAVSPETSDWNGRSLEALLSGGQPLFMFGERAGVIEVRIGNEDWYAALDITDDRRGAAAALISQDAAFAEWRKTV
ncbi:PAS domain-containing sensor histidine kinase, partial [Rhizobiaceae sp. 2RAB30]